jgi:hypothetical protein
MEQRNAEFWLEPESKVKCLKILVEKLITQQAETTVNMDTGCEYMFSASKLDELSLMFNLFERDGECLKHMILKMNPYIVTRGENITKDQALLKDPIEFTTKLMNFKNEMDLMVE